MMFSLKIKKTMSHTVIATLIGSVLLQGCSGSVKESSSFSQTLKTVDYDCFSMEMDYANHTFVIKSCDGDKDKSWEGKLLTFDYPKTANVYRAEPWENSNVPFHNPIKDWHLIMFQSEVLLMGNSVINDATSDKQLNRAERIGVINSLTRINTSDLEQIDKIKSGYSNVTFSDYLLKCAYPPVKSDVYELTEFDVKRNVDTILDHVKDRQINYYVIRRSLDGLPVGAPGFIECGYDVYDKNSNFVRTIVSEEYKLLYDGQNIYEVHNNARATEKTIQVHLKDRNLIPLEEAVGKVAAPISELLFDSMKSGKETNIYAIELVYLSDVKFDKNHKYEGYLYPFWVIYVHSNYMSAGKDIADSYSLLVNAVTGEVYVSGTFSAQA